VVGEELRTVRGTGVRFSSALFVAFASSKEQMAGFSLPYLGFL
jgi:hypothetical protein